jgi:hypothetical protein
MLLGRLKYLGHYHSKLMTVKYENKMRHIATGLTLLSLSLRIIEFLLHYKQSWTLYKGICCVLFRLNFPWGAFSSSWGLQGLFTSTSNEAGYLCTMCGETTKYSLDTEWTAESYAHSVTSSVVAEPEGSRPQVVRRDSEPIQYITHLHNLYRQDLSLYCRSISFLVSQLVDFQEVCFKAIWILHVTDKHLACLKISRCHGIS